MSEEHGNIEPVSPLAPSQVERDEVSIGLLAIVGTFIAVAVFLAVLLLQAWFFNWKEELTASRLRRVDESEQPAARMRIEQQEQIGKYRWVNREKQIRAIPIERAMKLVAKEMAAEGPGKP
jgi:hypothetical protein